MNTPQTPEEAYGMRLAEAVRFLKAHRDSQQPGMTPLVPVSDDYSREGMWREEAESMRRNPMEMVIYYEIREIGWEAYAEGGLPMMRKSMNAMSDILGEELEGYGEGAVDAKWNGIGVGNSVWLA